MAEWTREVPTTLGTFAGVRMSVVVEGGTIGEHGPLPRDLALVDEILASLPNTEERTSSKIWAGD